MEAARKRMTHAKTQRRKDAKTQRRKETQEIAAISLISMMKPKSFVFLSVFASLRENLYREGDHHASA
jgi:hypothetical protein